MKWLKQAWAKVKVRCSNIRKPGIRSRRRWYATIVAGMLAWVIIHFSWPAAQPKVAEIQVPIISYTQFMDHVAKGEVKSAVFGQSVIIAELIDGTKIAVRVAITISNPIDDMRRHGVDIVFAEMTQPPAAPANYAPVLLLITFGFWAYMIRRGIGPDGEIRLKFWGKSAEMVGRVTFADVAGADEAKAELEPVVNFLKSPLRRFKKVPKGYLLIGPPGTGKTLLARAVAGEANVPFYIKSGGTFAKMFVGVGPDQVRNLFDEARAHAPCVIFIDEVDAIATKRHTPSSGGEREFNNTLNQLLVELDGFHKSPGVIFMAATNKPEILDEAFLRPGRIDRQVYVGLPDARGREQILKVHAHNVDLPLAPDVDLTVIALGTPGFAGADLANLVQEAALNAEGQDPPAKSIAMRHFTAAKDKVMMGAERRSLVVTEEDRRRTAYHEVGHALVAMHTPGTDPVEKVSIMPRTRSLGVMVQLPTANRHHYTKDFLIARLTVMMGGRAAEELFFDGNVSAGAESDIEEATKLASNMVCRWGMSELGPITLKHDAGRAFSNRGGSGVYDCSLEFAARADQEIITLLTEALKNARAVLERECDAVHRVAASLCEHIDLSGTEIKIILEGGILPPSQLDLS